MSELTKRSVTALVLLFFAIGWMFYLPDDWFAIASSMLGLMATVELLTMIRMRKPVPFALSAALVWAILALTNMLLLAMVVLMLSWTVFLVMFARSGSEHDLGVDFRNVAYGQWMLVWLLVFVWSLNTVHGQSEGVWFLSGAFLGVWAADIAAYFVGRALGSHKLAPAISPGKSIEGSIGGLIAGVLISASFWLYMLEIPLWMALMLGSILVVVSIVGDLAESVLKRVYQVKDSGRMLPGHGGLLDRIDALIPALPVVGLLWMGMGVGL
ncbi:MAG: phosphatidate cytidylyltransferase [Zetaproteobacteria bacterium]|nr:phosphatidate cytidylyltransferase [Zetaproteobacteria bacterium]